MTKPDIPKRHWLKHLWQWWGHLSWEKCVVCGQRFDRYCMGSWRKDVCEKPECREQAHDHSVYEGILGSLSRVMLASFVPSVRVSRDDDLRCYRGNDGNSCSEMTDTICPGPEPPSFLPEDIVRDLRDNEGAPGISWTHAAAMIKMVEGCSGCSQRVKVALDKLFEIGDKKEEK